jgi:hypothetical protein
MSSSAKGPSPVDDKACEAGQPNPRRRPQGTAVARLGESAPCPFRIRRRRLPIVGVACSDLEENRRDLGAAGPLSQADAYVLMEWVKSSGSGSGPGGSVASTTSM